MSPTAKPTNTCSKCDHFIMNHYSDGCVVCDCERTFGATTLPEDNEPVQYKD